MKILLGKKIVLAAFVAAAALFSSCSKDDDKKAYEGTWTSLQTTTDAENKIEANITSNTFELRISVKRSPSPDFIIVQALKGDLTVTNDKMNIAFTEISSLDLTNGMLITLKKGDPKFEEAAKAMAIYSTVTFKVIADKLTITTASPLPPFVFTRAK